MRKQKAFDHADDLHVALRRRSAARLALALLALAPVLFELGLICHARWARVFHIRTTVRTPVLDRVGLIAVAVGDQLMVYFRRVPWRSDYVIAVGVISCAICMTLLRGRRAR